MRWRLAFLTTAIVGDEVGCIFTCDDTLSTFDTITTILEFIKQCSWCIGRIIDPLDGKGNSFVRT